MHQKSRAEQVSETINRNSDMVYRLAFSMVKNVQDAEDIYQETFIRYIRKKPLFESPEHEKAWFIRVTSNLCKNLWKSAWRQKMVSMESMEETQSLLQTEPESHRQEVNAAEGLSEEEESLVESVKRLPLKYRVVVHLFYYEEMSLEEIAVALKLKPSNVRTRLTRARKMLKEWLKEDV